MKRVAFAIVALSAIIISAAETFAQPREGADRRPPGRPNALMRLFDSDQDGSLSPSEIAGAAARLSENQYCSEITCPSFIWLENAFRGVVCRLRLTNGNR